MGNRVTLHRACECGDLAEVRRLLKTVKIEDLEATDDSGRTPLLLAVGRFIPLRSHEELLLDEDLDDPDGFINNDREGADWSNQGQEKRQEQPQPDGVHDTREGYKIQLVGSSNEAEILHLLLQRGVDVDHKDENGRTALHHACFAQNAVAIKMLIHAGARPMRESFGLLPQDLLQRGHMSEWAAQAQELKELLDQITDKSFYTMKLLAFRPSGIVQLDMGGQVEKGSFVTCTKYCYCLLLLFRAEWLLHCSEEGTNGDYIICLDAVEYDVPETHSAKDYIQVLISEAASADIQMGSYHYVPLGGRGQLTISTKDIPAASTVRFVYVKSDINTMSREVVASGCNAVVQASVGEIFQYELFLYDRVVEVESISEFEFIDQPLIVLKRIGIVVGEDIDWVGIRPDNHIVAVNDIRIDAMEFVDAVRILQDNNGRQCTKLLMQNYSACGDFIPEKILGVGVVGKYAYLRPVDEEQEIEGHEPTDEAWMRGRCDNYNEDVGNDVATNKDSQDEAIAAAQKATVDYNEDLPAIDEEKNSCSSSTIETVVPLQNSLELLAQLQHGISIGHAAR
uniref:Uncharacterized protein n=1 Tax=Hyaloperonospora arabidopsidis (strain Emoy2) TaxID=559515 RepID=M4B4P1_HYAAE